MDLVNAAKAKPGAINFGHAGVGSGTHLNTERFIAAAGMKVTEGRDQGTLDVSPQEFAKFARAQMDTYGKVIRVAGIKPQ